MAQVLLTAGFNIILTVESSGSAGAFFEKGTTDSMVLNMLGIGLTSVPNIISAFIHDILFLTILFGLITLLWKYKSFKIKIEQGFLLGILISLILLILLMLVPMLSIHYGAERVFIQTLAFLAPVFVIGAIGLAKIIKKPKLDVLIILIILISLFTCNTYLQYHLLGIPHSPYYENDGNLRYEYYIYDQELSAAKWLGDYGQNDKKIQFDAIAGSRFIQITVNHRLKFNSTYFGKKTSLTDGYIYLGYINVNKGIVYWSYNLHKDLKDYVFVFKNKNKIYDSGAEVYL